MDVVSIAQAYVDLQKQAVNHLFGAVTLVQDFADARSRYWIDQMGVDEQTKVVIDGWRAVLRRGRDDSIKLVNNGYACLASCLDGAKPCGQEADPLPTKAADAPAASR